MQADFKKKPLSLSIFGSASGNFAFECADGMWGREAEDSILCLNIKALILASELIRPLISKNH